MIPYTRHEVTDTDIRAVVEVLTSDHLTQGPMVDRFEEVLCAFTEAPHAVAVSSGTAALHLALRSLNVSSGWKVWVPALTFVATANAAVYCGAGVEVIDVDEFRCISTEAMEKRLKQTIPDVVIPVHFAGHPCDMEHIWWLAKTYGFRVVEDACHALGAYDEAIPVGAGLHSELCCFSFHPAKTIATGEGGAITTRNAYLAERIRSLRSHALTGFPAERTDTGYNYRLSDIHSALGHSQMKRCAHNVMERSWRASRYYMGFAGTEVKCPAVRSSASSSWHLFPVEVENRDRLRLDLEDNGIQTQVHYTPLSRWFPGKCPNAERYFSRAVSLPLYPTLPESDQDRIIDIVKEHR